MKNVLVAGATGYLGKHIVQECKMQGFQVRALARKTSKLSSIDTFIDETVEGSATIKDSISGICKDVDVVISSIGITKQKDGLTYMDVDFQANLNLLKEAQKSGVSKFIYVSVFNAHRMSHLKCIEAKLQFEQALKESGLKYTIIYPNGFFSDMLEYLQMAKKGRGFVFGSGDNKINPIHGKDLADVCVQAITGHDQEIHVGGPDVLTHNQILRMAFAVVKKDIKITAIPLWIRNASLAAARMLTSVKTYGPLEFFMTVLGADMVAPRYGSYRLQEFFLENR